MGASLSVFDKSLNPGDLIVVDRGNYSDWAVYIGEDEVVHFTRIKDSGPDKTSFNAEVKRKKLSVMLEGNSYRVNLLDNIYKPRDPKVIVKEARSKIGQKLTYDVVNYNSEHFATELRYGKPESRQSEIKLKPGDLIMVDRRTYYHWAVYIGKYEVVHLVRNDSGSQTSFLSSGQPSSKGVVRRDKLSDVINGDNYQVKNFLDHKYEPRNPDDIVRVAESRTGRSKYDVVNYNCEHFASEMRYGASQSRQVLKYVATTAATAATGAVTSAGAVAATAALEIGLLGAGAALSAVALTGRVGVIVGLTVLVVLRDM